jgi:phosphatidate cytidylyltransferase
VIVTEPGGAKDPNELAVARPAGSDLALRVVSSLVLAPLALGVVYVGDWPFLLFWAAAAIGIHWEWATIVSDRRRRPIAILGTVTLAVAAVLAGYRLVGPALAAMVVGSIAAGLLASPGTRLWSAGGVAYAGIAVLATTVLRGDPELGFTAIVVLFAVVWATDILGYFVGRAVGGRKLAPAVSPKKTWSGAIGGMLGAVAATLAVATYARLSNVIALAMLAVVLSAVSQAGDLCESAIKRRFGVKDASHVIPGHGGLMDRLDGFLAAAAVAAILGVLRGGLASPARSLLAW